MNPTRRTFLAGLSALAIAPAVAACGDTTTDVSGGKAGPTEENAFPATVTHKYGETTIEKAPSRVVCVGLVEQDALLALGIVPVAVTKWFGEAPGFIFPWAEDKLGDAELPTVLSDVNGVQIEKIANLQPDLIIGQYAGISEKDYDLLSELAPTIAQSGEYADYGMPWEESTLNIGTAVGQPKAAQALVDDVTAQIEKAAADHPEFAGKTAAVVTPYEGLFIYGPEDPRGRMLQQLGFEFPEVLLEDRSEEFGWSVSSERTSDLADVDAVVWLDYGAADAGTQDLFEQTPAYAEGRYFDISDKDGAYYVAHSFVTPLSIPYVLERYVPQLAAAVDGDASTEPPPAAA
jgi:iron complex transport system substrate-binding protein